MNYLAHLHLAPDEAQARVGNLLGDFIKPAYAGHLPPALQAGLRLHLQIDQYTDQHPLIRAARPWFHPSRQRFAGILLDIFFDHFLARDWGQWHPQPLTTFTQQVYAELFSHWDYLPPRLQHNLPAMQQEDWLGGYRELARIERVLAGFARFRLSRPTPFAAGFLDLQANYAEFGALFQAFYPQLQAHVAQLLAPQAECGNSPKQA
ncbi:ACP phosphodiesterase [Chitinibacter sp. ZOR0017]|uniref:acyl carrier protein phosphodiesterase n=1 Tax=Chitinibacter sp. ZOR0017 TaxID=1339254 RepID=UPI0006477E1F|nr:ACP phosphodiesterase [Chitinibacter sp. ZOR0017]